MREIDFSLDDEPAEAFFYDGTNRRIEVSFDNYYSLAENVYKSVPCRLKISNWSSAKSKLSNDTRYKSLDANMGIFSMILAIDVEGSTLKLFVNVLGERYVDLVFNDPVIEFDEI